jgi:hypothetical protein
MSDLLRLAAQLRLDSGILSKLLVDRDLVTAQPDDLFDLARLVLGKRRLEPIIRELPTAELTALRAGATTAGLIDRFLADSAGAFEQAVSLANELSEPNPPKVIHTGSTELDSYETLLAVAELIFASERHWLKHQKGGLSSVDARELATHLHCAPAKLQLQFDIARAANLIAPHGGRWLLTEAALGWLNLSSGDRWLALARAVNDLPDGFVPETESSLVSQLQAEYPLKELANLRLLRFGAALTLVSDSRPTSHLQLLAKGRSPDVGSLLPAAADRLILQSDLTITSPGPLSADLHRELDFFAEAESLGLAARFRVSSLSLSHALECGKTTAEIRALLGRFGELPQPFDYLLKEAGEKFGTLKVFDLAVGSKVVSADPIMLTQIANEPSLRSLGLTKSTESSELALSCRLPAEILYFNLREARYPAVRFDEGGLVVSPRVPAPETASTDDSQAPALAQRLTAGDTASDNDLHRKLGFALKHKINVRLQVKLPSGNQELKLTLLGVTDSRIRGRDLESEAERTLPLSAILEVELG